MNFLELLRNDVRAGLALAEPGYRERHARWLHKRQNPDGGFANRRGNSDLYYTAFALRALSALDRLTPEIAGACSGFLGTLARQEQLALVRQPSGPFCDIVA